MSYTFIPWYAMEVVYLVGIIFTFGFMILTLIRVMKEFQKIKGFPIFIKIALFVTVLYGALLFFTFVNHTADAGIYHDEHGTGPSDIEQNFHILNVILCLLVFNIANTIINKCDKSKN